MVLVQNKYKNTLVCILRTQITFVTHSSPSCYVTLHTQVIRLNPGNLGPQRTDSGVFTIIARLVSMNQAVQCRKWLWKSRMHSSLANHANTSTMCYYSKVVSLRGSSTKLCTFLHITLLGKIPRFHSEIHVSTIWHTVLSMSNFYTSTEATLTRRREIEPVYFSHTCVYVGNTGQHHYKTTGYKTNVDIGLHTIKPQM